MAALLLILQPVVFFWSVLVSRTAHIPYDLEAYHYPTLAYIAACLRHHQWPFWDPYTYAGMPLHADLQAQMFYPPAWLAMALGNLSAGRALFYWVEWMIAAHMILAGLFTFLLLRRMSLAVSAAFLGATVYQLGGFFASQACHLGAICAGAWLPLGLLAIFQLRREFRSRSFALLATSFALSILSGYAATTIVAVGATVLYCLALKAWRVLPYIGVAFLVATLISAVQLVPMLRLTSLSIASSRSGWLVPWGAPLESLVSLVEPNRYSIFDLSRYQLHQNFTLLYIYCGILPLLLVLAAPFFKAARIFGALTFVCAVWMLGEHTPVYPFFFALLPQLIRGASYAWFAMMAFGLFAGITAAVVFDATVRWMPASAAWLLAAAASLDLLHAGSQRPMNTAPGSYRVSSSEYQYGDSAENLRKFRDLVGVADPPVRIDYTNLWPPGVIMGPMLRLPTADGNIPFMLRRMYLLRSLFCATEPNPRDLAIAGPDSPIFRRNLPVNRPDSPLLRMLNTGFLAGTDPLAKSTASIAGLSINQISHPLPRFYLTPALRASSGAEQTFHLLGEPSFRPEEVTVVEGVSSNRSNLGSGTVTVSLYTPDRIELRVQSALPGFLATSETFYPGWEATVNGRLQPILLTNGVFRGLEIPQGGSTLIFSYHPVGLEWSALLSLAAMALTMACAFQRQSAHSKAIGASIIQKV